MYQYSANTDRIKVTLLGTGTSQGVPVIGCGCPVCRSVDFRDKRLRTSALIETGGQIFVIDTGPDFRQQMLNAKPQRLDAVLYTHEHKDHTAGLDDVRPFYFRQRAEVPIYATARVLNELRQAFSYAFATEKYPGAPGLDAHPIDHNPFAIGGVPIVPIQVLHGKMPVLGFRFGRFAYVTDANYIAPEEKEKLKNLDVLILNALHHEAHYSHFTLAEALQVVEELGPKKAYFTHISHGMGLHDDIDGQLPDSISLAYDGLSFWVEG